MGRRDKTHRIIDWIWSLTSLRSYLWHKSYLFYDDLGSGGKMVPIFLCSSPLDSKGEPKLYIWHVFVSSAGG